MSSEELQENTVPSQPDAELDETLSQILLGSDDAEVEPISDADSDSDNEDHEEFVKVYCHRSSIYCSNILSGS